MKLKHIVNYSIQQTLGNRKDIYNQDRVLEEER